MEEYEIRGGHETVSVRGAQRATEPRKQLLPPIIKHKKTTEHTLIGPIDAAITLTLNGEDFVRRRSRHIELELGDFVIEATITVRKKTN